MKKKCLVMVLIMVMALFVPQMTAMAGDINEAEQSILNALALTYVYKGGYYKVADEYVAKVTAYLSKDGVDLTSSEASNYLSQFYDNIGVGISSGYLVKVGDVPKATAKPTAKPAGGGEDRTAEQPQEADTQTWDSDSQSEEASAGESVNVTADVAVLLPEESVTEQESIAQEETVTPEVWQQNQNKDNTEDSLESEEIDDTAAEAVNDVESQKKEQADTAEPQEDSQDTTAEETPQKDQKDYSNAKLPMKSFSMEKAALLVIIVMVLAAGAVIASHKWKRK